MDSTFATSPAAPWSRSHSTVRMPRLEFDGSAHRAHVREGGRDEHDQRSHQRDPAHARETAGTTTARGCGRGRREPARGGTELHV